MTSNIKMIKKTAGKENDGRPKILILEQPSSKGLRFRYECEKKYASAIVGVNSKEHKRTYPTIKIVNWNGPVRIVVSCVTKDPPYRPHPHNLLGKIKVEDGICDFKFEDTEPALCFENLSIQCVKKKDVTKSLAVREKLGVDPFKTGFEHALNPSSIDLYSLRLCIEVFLEGDTPDVFDVPLQPVVTDPINDRRSKSEPEIVYITRNEGTVAGGEELGILCERADKDDIDVLFYREENNWEEIASFCHPGVVKRVAIVIKTPRYVDQDITESVEVKILLRRRSTKDVSDSFSYTYIPLEPSDKENPLKRKRDEDVYTSCDRLQKVLEKDKDQVCTPKNVQSSSAFNLPAKKSEENVDFRELESVTDLSLDAHEYSDPLSSPAKDSLSKNKNSVNNLNAKNSNGLNDEPKQWNYSNTLNSDDWIHELLQTIDDNLMQNKEPEIVKEPEIKYISPDPIPNTTNSVPAVQNHNNYIDNNVVNNNHQKTSPFNISNFVEKIPPLPDRFETDMSSLTNISRLQQLPPVIPHGHLTHNEQHPQYATNINGNQWSNGLNDETNRQPLLSSNYQYLASNPAAFSQMSVDNNLNGGNYVTNNRSYGTPMQPFNQENAWHDQIQRSTLDEFDPLYTTTTQTWPATQDYNGYTQ